MNSSMKTSTFICLILSSSLMMIFSIMNEMSSKKKSKKTPFECGFQPISQKKMTFSTSFLMLMMMFLIFDVEVSILIPFILLNKNNQNLTMLLSSAFIMTLAVLMIKEWKQGSLEWMK